MSAKKKFDRKRLREIVESYDGSLRMFEELRPDCYEQRVAAHSLEDLDSLYADLFTPGLSLNKLRETCPPWPPGSASAGQPPKVSVLQGIFDRFQKERRTESALCRLAAGSEAAEQFRRAVKTLPPKKLTETLDSILTVLGQEIMKAKLDEIPVSEQLQPLDRLMGREKLTLRAAEGKLKAKKLKLEERKQKALERHLEEAKKSEGKAGAMTKEAWEELERDLKLL